MRHFATPGFWQAYGRLPENVRLAADRSFEFLKANPQHSGLQLKRIGPLWSARIGIGYRALGRPAENDIVWFWIGSHADYDRLIRIRF